MYKILLFALTVGLCRLTFADGWMNGTLTYSIQHERFGRVGTHSVTIRGDQDTQFIEVTNRLSVPVLFLTYSERVRQTEIWQAGRLVSFRRTTTTGDGDAGEELVVSAWASGDRLVVAGGSGRTELPGDVMSSHPWNPRLLDQDRLMLAETGELVPVKVTAQSEDIVLAGGTLIPTRKYVLSGGLRRELWYDSHGLCVQVRLRKHGGMVTVTLQTPDDSHGVAAVRSALQTLLGESSESES